jgi:hypothetical protein
MLYGPHLKRGLRNTELYFVYIRLGLVPLFSRLFLKSKRPFNAIAKYYRSIRIKFPSLKKLCPCNKYLATTRSPSFFFFALVIRHRLTLLARSIALTTLAIKHCLTLTKFCGKKALYRASNQETPNPDQVLRERNEKPTLA